MRTMFDVSVDEVFKRIEQQSHLPISKTQKADSKEFAILLGDLEKTKENNDLSNNPSPILSNLSTNEWEQNVHLSMPSVNDEKTILSGPPVPVQQVLKNVKIPEGYVNNLTVEAPVMGKIGHITSAQEIPEAPVIKQAKRLSGVFQDIAHLSPNSRSELVALIRNRANHNGVDPNLSLAIATAESSLQVQAVSKDGFETKGLFQLKDTTGQDMLGRLQMSDHNYDPFEPKLNSHLGTAYLRYLQDIFTEPTQIATNLKTYPAKSASDLEKLAVAAFNTGQGNIVKAQQRAVREGKDPGNFTSIEAYISPKTRQYVGRVFALRSSFAAETNVNTHA